MDFSPRLSVLVALLLLLTLPPAARADSPALPTSYTQASRNGAYLFVMISPWPLEQDAHGMEFHASRIRAIREKYSQSGLYRNDGSTTPLWTVNWYAYSVDVASDGVHLIRHGPWASSKSQEAFTFFAGGRSLREVKISELVDFESLLPHSVSHVRWQEDAHFDDAAMTYRVSTKDGSVFVFDVRTGNTISATRWTRIWIAVAGIVLMFLLAAIFLRRRRAAPTTNAAAR